MKSRYDLSKFYIRALETFDTNLVKFKYNLNEVKVQT